jgi:hypothetical protein
VSNQCPTPKALRIAAELLGSENTVSRWLLIVASSTEKAEAAKIPRLALKAASLTNSERPYKKHKTNLFEKGNNKMKMFDEYLALQKQIFEYFGYVEDWRAIPLDDARENFWQLYQNADGSGKVKFAETMEKMESDGDYYCNDIYTQRFLTKWVYRGEDYTMICVDTHTDGNKFLQIFDNTLEVNTTDEP